MWGKNSRIQKEFSSGVGEGLNRKVNLITRKAFGYLSFEVLKSRCIMH